MKELCCSKCDGNRMEELSGNGRGLCLKCFSENLTAEVTLQDNIKISGDNR